jgi:transcription initiation factor TFIIE subunit alpha
VEEEMMIAETLLVKMSGENLRLTQKKINEVVSALAGEESVPVVELIMETPNLSEFVIAEELEWEISKVRQILYRLHTYGLAVYKRKKDRKKGWYISYWTFRKDEIKNLIVKLKEERLEHLKDRLEREEKHRNNFYLCPSGCMRLDFDQAFENEFRCSECGQVLGNQDNTRTIEFLKEKIALLEMSEE